MPTAKLATSAAKRDTIRAIVVRSWSTESCFGVSYFFKLRPVVAVGDSGYITSTIPDNVIASSPCGERGRIHGLVGAEVELTGRIVMQRGERRLSGPRGRVVKLMPAMAARLVEEQELDAVVKAAWANGCPHDEEA
jgi:hypothetical protein